MKIQSIWFDDLVVIAGAKDLGSAHAPQDLREQSFHASEGWDIEQAEAGVFRLFRAPMTKPVTVGGYGYSYVQADEPVKRGKK